MWIWRLNAANGQVQYDDTLNNLDGDTASPHVRLPRSHHHTARFRSGSRNGVTIPSDMDGAGTSDGAEFVGLDVIDASEIFSFTSSMGMRMHPLYCWILTTMESPTGFVGRSGIVMDSHGRMVGCHDYNEGNQNTFLDWNQIIEGTSGNPNDEIAVSAPTAMDIDGTGMDEIIVTFGLVCPRW